MPRPKGSADLLEDRRKREGVWSLAKRDLANSCPKHVDELMEDILRSIERIKDSPEKLRGCILQSELPSFYVLNYCIIYAAINKREAVKMKLKMPARAFQAYLFHCDGSIADSMPLHYVAWKSALAEWNCDSPEELVPATRITAKRLVRDTCT